MMTDKLREAAKAALEELLASESNAWNIINDLEAALAEPEPVAHPFEDASVISALYWASILIEKEYPVGHNGADSWLMNYSDKHGENVRRSDHRDWEKVHGRWKPKAALAEPAIKESLTVEEPEPAAWTTMPEAEDWCFVASSKDPTGKLEGKWFPLYTAPPRREFVGLTDEEITEIRLKMFDAFATNYEAYRAIEAKLREKND
jgi:hypothetical protein